MQIKTLTLTIFALAVACASAENATFIGCYYDCQSGTAPCGDTTTSNRDLPFFFCSNGKDPNDLAQCALDPSTAFPGQYAGARILTPQFCSGLCKGFKFFGVQEGHFCSCGNDFGNQGGKVPESDCNYPCTGSSAETCGAVRRNSIYAQPPSMYNATTSSH